MHFDKVNLLILHLVLFTFSIKTNSQANTEESVDKQATNENLNLESGTYTVAVHSSRLHEIKNVVVKSYFW